jgi:peptide/nickel transport system substrate-binding protein
MATRSRRRPVRGVLVILLALASVAAIAVPDVLASETPRRGGTLLVVIGADPPSLDPHQESTFANIQLVAPLYSTLLQLDPHNYPKIIGDAAREWKVSPDGLTYTFKLHPGIKFHDGSVMTSADVKATYEKIINPPKGTRSVRRNAYTPIAAIETPDPTTVVFTLKFPSASLLSNLASPWNVLYPKKYLDQDPNYFMKNVVGSGPFKFKSYTRGSTFEGVRNPDYFVKGRPYLDGYKFFISTETSVRAAAVRSGRAYIEFRDLPVSEVEAIKRQLGDRIAVQEGSATGWWGIAVNNTVKPFDDIRVRKALTLAVDRYTGGKVLYPLTGLSVVGGLMRPGSEWAISDVELARFPGFWRDADKSRAEARKLLAEAGFAKSLRIVMKNRNVKLPYQDFAVYLIQEWRKVGIEVENRPLETAAWYSDCRDNGNFELCIQPGVEFMDDPDNFLRRYTPGDPQNWGRFNDPRLEDLFARQARALDEGERKKLVNEIDKIVLENAYYMPGLWWTRRVVHWAKVKGYTMHSNHYSNQKLQDVWLSED